MKAVNLCIIVMTRTETYTKPSPPSKVQILRPRVRQLRRQRLIEKLTWAGCSIAA